MRDLSIRTAGAEDAAVLAELVLGFRDHLGADIPTEASLARDLPAALAAPEIEFRCAWLAGRPAGFAHLVVVASIWAGGIEVRLEDLFVATDARRRGVGRALLRDAIDRSIALGARRFNLATNEGNEAAQALYRSEGLAPQSHARYPGGREVMWSRPLPGAPGSGP